MAPASLLVLGALVALAALPAPSGALLTCGSYYDAEFNVTWPAVLADATAAVDCPTGAGQLTRRCCGALSLGYTDSAGDTCTLLRVDTYMAVDDGCEAATSVSLGSLAELLINKDEAAGASAQLKAAIEALGAPRAADLSAALRASSSILGALDLGNAPNITLDEIVTWLTVKDALDLILGDATPASLASARQALRRSNADAGVRNAAPDPIVNLATTVVDAYRYANRLTEIGAYTEFQMGTYNASVVANRNATATRINASSTLHVDLPETVCPLLRREGGFFSLFRCRGCLADRARPRFASSPPFFPLSFLIPPPHPTPQLLRLGIVSALVFDIDPQARNSSDYPASAGIEVSITPFDSSADASVANHATLPDRFDVQFNRSADAFAFAGDAGDVERRKLAASLLELAFSDIASATLLESGADAEGVSPASPALRVTLTASAVNRGLNLKLARVTPVVEVSNASLTQLRLPLRFECRWWSDDGWATGGCSTGVDDNGDVVCRCDHMTSFAVFLTGSGDKGIDSANAAALSAITYTGGAISLVCLAATVFLFLFYRKRSWVEAHQLIIANLALALLGVHVCFILAIDDSVTSMESACQTVAVLLHYFLLTSFAWMAVEGYNLYKSFVRVMEGHKVGEHGTLIRYAIGAWSLPAVVVAITAGARPTDYGTEDYCWIDVSSPSLYGFVVPIAVLCAFNLVVLLMVARTLKKNIEGRAAFRAAFAFFWLMGLGWIFGLLLLVHDHLVWRYLFAIFMAVQGMFIFLTQCMANRRVRSALKEELSSSSRRERSRSTRQTDSSSRNSARRTSSRPHVNGGANRGSVVVVDRRLTGNFNSRLSTSGEGTRFKLRLGSTLSEDSTPTRNNSIAEVKVERNMTRQPSIAESTPERPQSRSSAVEHRGLSPVTSVADIDTLPESPREDASRRQSNISVSSADAALGQLENRIPLGPVVTNPPSDAKAESPSAATQRPSLEAVRAQQRAKRNGSVPEVEVPVEGYNARHLPRHLYELAEEEGDNVSRRSSVSIV